MHLMEASTDALPSEQNAGNQGHAAATDACTSAYGIDATACERTKHQVCH